MKIYVGVIEEGNEGERDSAALAALNLSTREVGARHAQSEWEEKSERACNCRDHHRYYTTTRLPPRNINPDTDSLASSVALADLAGRTHLLPSKMQRTAADE